MVPATAVAFLLAGFVGGVILEFFVIRVSASVRLLAIPNQRSFHAEPTPTAGGLVFVLPVMGLIGLFAFEAVPLAQGLFAGGALLALVSLWDDYREVPAWLRFACQLVAVALAAWGLQLPWHWWLVALVGLGMLWHVNLYNFMDGIDGIAGVQCLLFCVGAQLLTLGIPGWSGDLVWLLIGTVLAFLVYNWPAARIFMGDVGSAFLGLLLAVLVVELWQSQRLPLVASLILLAGFWFDATYTLCVRMATGQPFTQAHRSHTYQQLADRKGHRFTTMVFLAFGIAWLLPLAWLSVRYPSFAGWCLVLALLPLAFAALKLRAGVRRNLRQEDLAED